MTMERDSLVARLDGAMQRLNENLASFDAEAGFELSNEGERADLWSDIDVNVEDLRVVLAAAALSRPEQVVTDEMVERALDAAEYIPNTDNRKWMRAALEASCLTTAAPLQADASAPASPAMGVRAVKALPPQEVLRSLFNYNPDTGKLFRKIGGKEAFTFGDRSGYRHGKIHGVKYQAHRVIWKLVYGEDPEVIDHINGEPSDNRLVNLRDCTVAENSRNYSKASSGSSKYRGVCWVKRDKAWAARISTGHGGKKSLGNYKNEEDAARAYDTAARQLHGQFAVLNFPEEV